MSNGKSAQKTTGALLILRRMQEVYYDKEKLYNHVFCGYGEAFDRVPRKVIEWSLRKNGVQEIMVTVVSL